MYKIPKNTSQNPEKSKQKKKIIIKTTNFEHTKNPIFTQ